MEDAGMADDQSDQIDSLKRKRVRADEEQDTNGQSVQVGRSAAKATGKPVLSTKALRSVLKGELARCPFSDLVQYLSEMCQADQPIS